MSKKTEKKPKLNFFTIVKNLIHKHLTSRKDAKVPLFDYEAKTQLFYYRKESNTQALNPKFLTPKENFVLEVVNTVVDDYFNYRSVKGLAEMIIDHNVFKNAQSFFADELRKEVDVLNKPTENDLKFVCDCQHELVKGIERDNKEKIARDKYVYPLILIISLVIAYITYEYEGKPIPFALNLVQMLALAGAVSTPFMLYKSETDYDKKLLREKTVLAVLKKLRLPSV